MIAILPIASSYHPVRVLSPSPGYHPVRKISKVNIHLSINKSVKGHELDKKRAYADRVRSVESASFTPLVFSTFGGLGREATIFIVALPTCLLYDITFSTVKCCPGCAVPSLSPYFDLPS